MNSSSGGFFQVPASLVERQGQLTHAEVSLALIVLREGGLGSTVKVSDTKWLAWTGLSPRAKEYAIAGLREKCLRVVGRGDTAKFAFDRSAWARFVLEPAAARARTNGRATTSRPVHADCKDRGCALLAREALSGQLPTDTAQPVAQSTAEYSARLKSEKTVKPLSLTQIAQPVAAAAAEMWAGALGALRTLFPAVGLAFLGLLVAAARRRYPDVTDTELVEAVGLAWRSKHSIQRGEGLFLATVPDALDAIRRRAPVATPPAAAEMPTERARDMLHAARDWIAASGVVAPSVASEIQHTLALLGSGARIELIDTALVGLERRVSDLVIASDPALARRIQSEAEADLSAAVPGGGNLMPARRAELMELFRNRAALRAAGLSLSLF